MMGRLLAAASIAALAVVVAACTPFGRADDEASRGDMAGGDAGAPDAAADAALDNAPLGCDATHTFCDDFDDGDPSKHWTRVQSNGPAVVEILGGNVKSPPAVLGARVDPFESGAYTAFVQKHFDGAFHGLSCQAWVFVEKMPSRGTPTLLRVDVMDASAESGLEIFVGGGGTSVGIGQDSATGSTSRVLRGASLVVGTWSMLAVSIASDGTILATVDGRPIAADSFPRAPFPAPAIELSVGAIDVAESDGASFRFDDVSCDLTP